MILHTIISPADIFFEQENAGYKCKDKTYECITDPYFFLEKDGYYSKYIQAYDAQIHKSLFKSGISPEK